MKDICQAVYEKLCSDSSISRYVCGRIYPIVLPEDAPLPAIVYTPVLANYDSALQGDTGFVRQTMQLVCHDTTYKKARELSRKVKCVFQDYSGDMCGLYKPYSSNRTMSITGIRHLNSIRTSICRASNLNFILTKNRRQIWL